jgi:hypothetical protein
MVLPYLASFLRAWMIVERSPEARPTASRPWRSKVVIWRSRSASGLRFGLEKFPASIKRTEIKIPGMRFAVAIFEDSKGWAFHGPK